VKRETSGSAVDGVACARPGVEDGPDELGPSVGGRREEMRMTSGTITLKRNESERGDMLAAKPAISIFLSWELKA